MKTKIYMFYRLADLLSGWLLIALLALQLAPSVIYFTGLALFSTSFVTIRIIYNYFTLLMPALLIVAGLNGLRVYAKNDADDSLKQASMRLLLCAFCLIAFRVYATHIEPVQLYVRHVTIETDKVKAPVRIVHVSDIQSQSIGWYEEEVVKRINALRPDIVLYTGDMIQPRYNAHIYRELPKLNKLMGKVVAPLGFYGVYGNIDRKIFKLPWRQGDNLRRLEYQALGKWPDEYKPIKDDKSPGGHLPVLATLIPEETAYEGVVGRLYRIEDKTIGNLKLLYNESVRVEADYVKLNILGISYLESCLFKQAKPRIDEWFDKTQPDEFTIILGHAPDYVKEAKDKSVDLMLAGHTHGGQVRIPFIGAVRVNSYVPRSWGNGYREVGSTRINVSAGAGSERAANLPPIRINCPTELTLIILKPKTRH